MGLRDASASKNATQNNYFKNTEQKLTLLCVQNWSLMLCWWWWWGTPSGQWNNCACTVHQRQWNAKNGSRWLSVPFKWHFIRQPKSQLQGDPTKKLSHGTAPGLTVETVTYPSDLGHLSELRTTLLINMGLQNIIWELVWLWYFLGEPTLKGFGGMK